MGEVDRGFSKTGRSPTNLALKGLSLKQRNWPGQLPLQLQELIALSGQGGGELNRLG